LKYFCKPFTGWLVRIGPDAEEYGDPYWWVVAVSTEGELTGFSSVPPTAEGLKTALRAAIALGFPKPIIDRRGANPRTLEVSNGVTKGAFIVKRSKHDRAHNRKHMPHIEEAMKDDGTMDVPAMEAALPEVVAAVKAGKLKILSGHQIDLPNNEDLLILHRKHS